MTQGLPSRAEQTWVFPQQAGGGPGFGSWPGSGPGGGHGSGAGQASRAAAPRDSWPPDSDRAGHDPTVDPHEVTVQLDAVQLGDGLIRRAASAAGGQDVSDGPVFVDASGRRSRHFRRFGMAVAVACAVYAVVIVATLLSGSSDAPWLPVPGQKDEQPAGQVDTTPLPTASAQPTGTGSPEPDSSAPPGDSTSPLPGTGATGAPATPDGPGTSIEPQPAETRTTSRPGTGGGADPAPTKTTPPPDTDPEPVSTPTGPTARPTETAGNGAPAVADTVAAGPGDPAPVAASSREEQGALSSPSPEYDL
ncbi:hypothetical protein [Streptomyces sp. DH24]|uniref:hypothetical protein n=1 Tax=Streptomyces sp. DH24 TaxID=3040123 RepID=UPI0024413911|nr:hypothetical protein [Streptomyces sp. DH24]MDG9720318.1 hypothetical protein [Streptomyces sp. DH24]